MIIHKILRGEGAEKYLPFALAKQRQLERLFGTEHFITQKYDLGDAQVEVELAPPAAFVRITATEELYFEFLTTGWPVVNRIYTQDNNKFAGYYPYAVNVSLLLDANRELVAKPTIRNQGRNPNAVPTRNRRTFQVGLINEPCLYPVEKKDRHPATLYQCWSPLHPYTGMLTRTYNQGSGTILDPGSSGSTMERDFYYDIGFEYLLDGQKAGVGNKKTAYLLGNRDWPRRSGVQIVTHQAYGPRTFAIYVDVFNQFSVFPISQIEPFTGLDVVKQNVNEKFIKTMRPTFPVWAHVATVTKKSIDRAIKENAWSDTINQPETDWQLTADGTKACAIVVERVPVAFDQSYFTQDPEWSHLANPLTTEWLQRTTGIDSRQPAYYPAEGLNFQPQRYMIGPGIIEVSIQITITGPNPEDFALNLTTTEIRSPRSSPYCSLMVGYAWQDTPDKTVSKGDMLVIDVERWYKPNDSAAVGFSFMSLKNLTKNTEVRAFSGAALVACDLHTVSWVVELRAYETVTRTLATLPGPHTPTSSPDKNYIITHPAIAVYTQNALREVLFADEMTNAAARTTLTALASINPRDQLTPPIQWAYLPLNDLPGWGDARLSVIRDYYARRYQWQNPEKEPFASANPSAQTWNWWHAGATETFPPIILCYVTTPYVGWWAYTDEIITRIGINTGITFFVHPNGTWAFFSNTGFYNRHGTPVLWGGDQGGSRRGNGVVDNEALTMYDTLTPMLAANAPFASLVYDRVHFNFVDKKGNVKSKDETFLGLYNKAIEKADAFGPLTLSNFKARFFLNVVTGDSGYPEYPHPQVVELRIVYAGAALYWHDRAYHGNAQGLYSLNFMLENEGTLRRFDMGMYFEQSSSQWQSGLPLVTLLSNIHDPVFSTCTLIGA